MTVGPGIVPSFIVPSLATVGITSLVAILSVRAKPLGR